LQPELPLAITLENCTPKKMICFRVEIYNVLWEKLRKPDWFKTLLVVFLEPARKSLFKKV